MGTYLLVTCAQRISLIPGALTFDVISELQKILAWGINLQRYTIEAVFVRCTKTAQDCKPQNPLPLLQYVLEV